MTMTSEQYVEKKGVRCPVCGSYNLTGEEVTIDYGQAFQWVSCDDCDSAWLDEYQLTGYTDLEEGQEEV